MTTSTPPSSAGHLPSADSVPANPWLLRIDKVTGDVSLDGGLLASRGETRGFVAGWLAAPTSIEDVFNALEEQGEPSLAALRGQFALVLVDDPRRQVLIVRDPLGTYPVFYAETSQHVWCSSSIARLLEQPGISADLNRVAILDHICKRWPDREETFFAAVRRVPSGSLLSIAGGQVSTRRYWDATGDRIEWLPDEEVDRFDALLDQAVARGLSGACGIFLSGGFDSVSVAAVAADLARRRGLRAPHALSLGFPDPACDEQRVQESVASRLGLTLDLVPFDEAAGPGGLLARGLDLNVGLSAPLFNSWLPAYLTLVERARAAGVTTILTGEGGDEWLGTSPFLAADLIRRGDLAGVVRVARTWHRSYHQSWPTVVRGIAWTFGLRPLAGMWCSRVAPTRWDDRRARRAIQGVPAWVVRDPDLQRLQLERARASLAPADPPGGFYDREARTSMDLVLQARLFEEQFEIGQARGVRYVHPYWDPDVIAHVCRVRPERLDAGYRNKALVRQTLARRFPGFGFERQRKVAAMDFFAGIIRREAPGLARRLTDFRGLADLGVVEPEQARAFVNVALRGSVRDLGWAWNLVNMEDWVRQQTATSQRGSR